MDCAPEWDASDARFEAAIVRAKLIDFRIDLDSPRAIAWALTCARNKPSKEQTTKRGGVRPKGGVL